MSPNSETQRYHLVAMRLHWIIALLLVGNLALGFMLGGIPQELRGQAYMMHKSLGLSVLMLTLVRLLWRILASAPPMESVKGWEKNLAVAVHALIYLLTLAIPFSGWLLVSASGKYPTIFFNLMEWPHLPFFMGFAEDARRTLAGNIAEAHEKLSFALVALLALHVAAALRHHWFLKDDTLLRMMPASLDGGLRRLRGEKPR